MIDSANQIGISEFFIEKDKSVLKTESSSKNCFLLFLYIRKLNQPILSIKHQYKVMLHSLNHIV